MKGLADSIVMTFFLFMELAPQSNAQASVLDRWARHSAEVSS
jgi:hypothetical protein